MHIFLQHMTNIYKQTMCHEDDDNDDNQDMNHSDDNDRMNIRTTELTLHMKCLWKLIEKMY